MDSLLLSRKYGIIHTHVLGLLQRGLSPQLSYHCVEHTIDVLDQGIRIAGEEGITNQEDLFILKIASLYHDTGFMFTYVGHEDKSWELAKRELPGWGITDTQLERIHGLINATHIPQTPNNILEQIICDADLDYLGRDDFFPIAKTLFQELFTLGMVKGEQEWNRIQVNFLSSHRYFTQSSIRLRGKKETQHLEELKKIVSEYSAS